MQMRKFRVQNTDFGFLFRRPPPLASAAVGERRTVQRRRLNFSPFLLLHLLPMAKTLLQQHLKGFAVTPIHSPLPREQMRRAVRSVMSAAEKVQIRENATKNPDAVLSFLKSYGFDDTHLASLISRHPEFLLCRSQTTLKPKIDLLIGNGFRGPLFHELILRNPNVLKRTVKTYLEPIFHFFRTYILTFEELHTTILDAVGF
ncbi:uncharacterized protein LOC116189300 [Punica granatum]|uniref:Uncharacterized protein LOC116189300 n=1 Tax=Punica granatum TaxID=22663 RepID=A0A6P8BYT8_PUNGR|nr:uncharacterized protein LOC116189300 [Punica granatum]